MFFGPIFDRIPFWRRSEPEIWKSGGVPATDLVNFITGSFSNLSGQNERLKYECKRAARRIRNQRAVLRQNWKIVEERNNEYRAVALRAVKKARDLQAENDALRAQLAARDVTISGQSALIAALSAMAGWPGEVYRHLKRGSEYALVAIGKLQSSGGPVHEGDTLVAYIGEDGQFWFRKESEFRDGRFVRVTK